MIDAVFDNINGNTGSENFHNKYNGRRRNH